MSVVCTVRNYNCLIEVYMLVSVAQALKAFNANVNAFTRSTPSAENRCKHVDKYW